MKIVVTEPHYFKDIIPKLRKLGKVVARRMSRKELMKEIEDCDILIIRIETKVDKPLLSRARKLKIIASATTSLNHIDLNLTKERNIKVINIEDFHSLPTSEFTFALILALSKKLPWAFEDLKRGNWRRFEFFGLNINKKVLGIIGFGRVGKKVAEFAKAFGMKVLVYDPYVKRDLIEEKGFKKVGLEKLLKSSDFISVHCSLNEETRNLINKKNLRLVKKGAFIINTARGEIINEKDLLKYLMKRRIYAALDVFKEEPLSKKSFLIKFAKKNKNLIITPHIAASTREAVRKSSLSLFKKLKKEIRRI